LVSSVEDITTGKMWNKKKAELAMLAGEGEYSPARRNSAFLDHSVTDKISPGPRPSGIPKSLGDVLSNSELRHKFRLFLKERHSSESLMFYESIELFEKIPDIKWRKRAGEGLLAKFVMEEADLEVNISSSVRTKLLRTTRWEKDAFADAKSEMYDLLKTNFFSAFVAREFLNDQAS